MRFLVVGLLLLLCTTAQAAERLAVLELSGAGLPPDQLAALTDAVRGGVKGKLGNTVQVMTKENMEVMLTDMGLDASCISEGACEVETARNLGVDHVVSGTLTMFGEKLVVSLKLHETASGQLLSTKQSSATEAFELLEALPNSASTLVTPLAPGAAATIARPAPARVVPVPRPSTPALPTRTGAHSPTDRLQGKLGECKGADSSKWRCKGGSETIWVESTAVGWDFEAYLQVTAEYLAEYSYTNEEHGPLTLPGLPEVQAWFYVSRAAQMLNGNGVQVGGLKTTTGAVVYDPSRNEMYHCQIPGRDETVKACPDVLAKLYRARTD